MVEVRISFNSWRNTPAINPHRNNNTQSFHLRCGLIIPCENVECVEWIGSSESTPSIYVVRFTEEKDATWFILNAGGDATIC